MERIFLPVRVIVFCCALLFPWPCHCQGNSASIGVGDAILLGSVQGLAEFYPISSSIHVRLADNLLARCRGATVQTKNYGHFFSVATQLASLLPALFFFHNRIGRMFLGLLGRSRSGAHLLCCLCLAVLPCIPVGFFFDRLGWQRAVGWRFAGYALLFGGIYLFVVEKICAKKQSHPKKLEDLGPIQALAIGLLQCAAFAPGVSRSLMVLTGGLICGLSTVAAVEFCFLVGCATTLAATAHALLFSSAGGNEFFGPVVAGCLAAFACGWLGLFLLLRWLRHGSLRPFACYRMALGMALLIASGA
ncbi:MAG: undecaprenyl-diphosphate phosphatase [Puniceicoccales bacterium]|nr:undecaprenyl-diphosphate phosphatase [Puniceicoccales bacterium]